MNTQSHAIKVTLSIYKFYSTTIHMVLQLQTFQVDQIRIVYL